MAFGDLNKEAQKEYIMAKIEIINSNLQYYNELYQNNFDSDFCRYQKAFMDYIELTKNQLREIDLTLSYKEYKDLKINTIVDSLTMVYIELVNGQYRPLEVINGKITV